MPATTLPRSSSPSGIQSFLDGLRRPEMSVDGLSIRHDVRHGRVDVVGHGFWSVVAVEQHFRDLATIADAIHAAGVPARVLVDLRDAAVQSIESTQRIGRATRSLWRGEDRVAVLLASRLVTMQMARVVDEGHHRMFADINEAEAWLGR